jgi:hypothetical protein
MSTFVLFAQQSFLKQSISILLTTFFLNVTLTFADEPAEAALPNPSSEKADRIKKLQHLSLEDLQKVPIIHQQNQRDKTQNLSELKNPSSFTCPSKNLDDKCK